MLKLESRFSHLKYISSEEMHCIREQNTGVVFEIKGRGRKEGSELDPDGGARVRVFLICTVALSR